MSISTETNRLPSFLHIRIAPEIFASFPQTKVSFLILSTAVLSKKNQPKEMQKYLSDLKQSSVQQIVAMGVTPESYQAARVCNSWRSVFNTFNAGDDKKSTIENLLRRGSAEGVKVSAGKKADMGAISSFVDLYNSVSLSTMTPMGATDISRISQTPVGNSKTQANVELRFAHASESFIPLGKEATEVALTPTSVVYADDEKVLTGFWNWKDSKECCVPAESARDVDGNFLPEYILLVADQAHQDEAASAKAIQERPGDAEEAILRTQSNLARIGGTWYAMDILSASRPEVTFDISNIAEGEVVLKG